MKNFLSFVEIKTKLASLLPFLMGVAYSMYQRHPMRWGNTLVFFVAMLLFDMATTAINNHIGTRASGIKPHYSSAKSIAIIVVFILVAAVLGIYLTIANGLAILLIGVLCFLTGIFYTFGPIPIAHSAYGEIFSGGVMGFFIPLIAVLINAPKEGYVSIAFAWPQLQAGINLIACIKLFIAALPFIMCIANIMFANNICDVEADILIRRYTLPYYLGRKRSLTLFALIYYCAFAAILLSVVFRIVPIICALSLLTLLPVVRNIRAFADEPVKSKTFALSVQNFVVMCASYTALIFLGALIM